MTVQPASVLTLHDGGRIRFTCDLAREDYYIDAEENYSSVAMKELLADIEAKGFQLMTEEAAPFDVLTVNGVEVVRGYVARIAG